MKPSFVSKEYGIGGHNKLDVRVMGEDVQVWIKDGDVNAIICMDREDLTKLGKTLSKLAKKAPETIEASRDYSLPTRKRKVELTSEANGVTTSKANGVTKKKRKTRSDKGKKRVKSETYEQMKTRKITEAMDE